jgi:ribosomal protein S11
MVKNYNSNINLNKFFKKIVLKKQYIKKLTNKTCLLESIQEKNYKSLNYSLFFKKKYFTEHDNLVVYIIDISFSRSNTLLHVMDSSGILKFFCSAGDLSYTGKSKKARVSVLKAMIRILVRKLKFLQNKPIALHLKNVRFRKFWIVKRLKKKFFIKVVRSFNLYPHNGCRKRKIRRKKIKKKIKVTRRNG